MRAEWLLQSLHAAMHQCVRTSDAVGAVSATPSLGVCPCSLDLLLQLDMKLGCVDHVDARVRLTLAWVDKVRSMLLSKLIV